MFFRLHAAENATEGREGLPCAEGNGDSEIATYLRPTTVNRKPKTENRNSRFLAALEMTGVLR